MRPTALLILVTAFVIAVSCNKKQETTDIIVEKPVEEAPSGPVKMHEYRSATNVEWLGKNYRVLIDRHADTDLPVVTDEATGAQYYDNRISVEVMRSDSSLFFRREFVKDDFAPYVDASYIGKSALLGFVLEEVKGDDLQFAASVGAPDILSDEYVPLIITLSKMGKLKIELDDRADMIAQPEDEGV